MLLASSRTSKTWATQKPSTDSILVAQPYRCIPPHQLQEVQEHIKGLLAQKVIVESHSPYAGAAYGLWLSTMTFCASRPLMCSWTSCSGHRPQERRGNSPLRRLSQAQCKDSWRCLSSSEDPRVFWCAGRGPVLFDSGPGQRLPSNCHASQWPAQDVLRDADGAVWVHQNADGPVISASDLPTPHTVHDVRLHLPVPAGVPGRSAGVLQDVCRAPCPPWPSSAAHHWRWLKLKMDKCQFSRRQVHYLGHTISAEGVSCEAGKVEAVKNWPVPATTTALRSCLGFASCYRCFIQGFSKIAGLLHDLVAKRNARHKKKGADISNLFDRQHQKAFEELKTALTTAPVLGFAEFTKPFILETDASQNGLSAILLWLGCRGESGHGTHVSQFLLFYLHKDQTSGQK